MTWLLLAMLGVGLVTAVLTIAVSRGRKPPADGPMPGWVIPGVLPGDVRKRR